MKMRGFQWILWIGLTAVGLSARAAAAAEEAKPSVFEGYLGESIWALLWFGILLVVLWRFAWKPLLKGLSGRQEYIERQITDAEKTRSDASKVLDEYGAKLADAERQGRVIIAERVKDAEKQALDVHQKNQSDLEAMKSRAQAELDREKIEAEEQLWDQAGDIILRLGTEVFGKNLGDVENQKLIAEAIARLRDRSAK
ncbi:MAG: ATP synthase F0 subunit B [Planctomycetaceae bacterium]|nr:ATP synthase F0 subunit B [Planctomycetaceae bacterium]